MPIKVGWAIACRDGIFVAPPFGLPLHGGGVTVPRGPSGASQSTLLRSLNGLVPPTGRQGRAASIRQHHRIGRVSLLGNLPTGRPAHPAAPKACRPPPRAGRTAALRALARMGRAGSLPRGRGRALSCSRGSKPAQSPATTPRLRLPRASRTPQASVHIAERCTASVT